MTFGSTRFAELMDRGLASFEAERLLCAPGSDDPTDRSIEMIHHRIAYLDAALSDTFSEEGGDVGKGKKLLSVISLGLLALIVLGLLVSIATVLAARVVGLEDASIASAFFAAMAAACGLGAAATRQRAQYWRRRRQIGEELYLLGAAAVQYYPQELLEETAFLSTDIIAHKNAPSLSPPRPDANARDK